MPSFKYTPPIRAIAGNAIYPAAQLSVFASGTGTLVEIYADGALETPRENPLSSDVAGYFPAVYLDSDKNYRIVITDQDGNVIVDEDGFGPRIEPLTISSEQPKSASGAALPLAQYTFYAAYTTQLIPIYSNEGLTTELDNPISANASGVFVDIWLDQTVASRVLLKDRNGILQYDIEQVFYNQGVLVPPGAPVLSGDLVAGPAADLEWTASEVGSFPIDHYLLFRSVNGGAFTLVSTVPVANPRTYHDTVIDLDDVYAYKVKAVDTGAQESPFSNIVTLEASVTPMLVALSSGTNAVMRSPDGITWTQQTTPNGAWQGICHSRDLTLFVVVGNSGTDPRSMTSPDAITWTANIVPVAAWTAVTWAPELAIFVAVGFDGAIMTSANGIAWTLRTAAAAEDFTCVTWAPEIGLFLAGSVVGSRRIQTSPDGINWSLAISGATTSNVYAIAWSGALAVTVNRSDNNNLYSADGVNWSAALGISGSDIAFGASLFVRTSISGNRIRTTADGITWTSRTPAALLQWEGICFSELLGLFVATAATGTDNRVMTSPDGINWTSQVTPSSANSNSWNAVIAATL